MPAVKNTLNNLADGSSNHNRRVDLLFFLLTVAFGVTQIFSCRYQLTPDAMDYLDIAREVAAGHWGALANGYWGTLFSLLISPVFLFHISPQLELPLAHLFGLFMLLVVFLCFRFCLHCCLDTLRKSIAFDDAVTPIPEPALCVVGYSLFLWSALTLVPVREIGPDALVSAIVYLAAAMLLRLRRDARLLNFALFGFILAIGYWAKAVMFPVGIMFLGTSTLKVRQWKGTLLSAIAFVILAAPLLAALSLPRGRFTFGDSGLLTYAVLVSPGGRDINWQGDPPGSGVPQHTTRQLTTRPAIYEFNGPIAGTYPPSYDPSYWNEGHKSTFNLRAQMAVVAGHFPALVEVLFVAQPSLTAAFLFFLLWNPVGFIYSLTKWWPLLTISLAIIGLYMLVHLEVRFIGSCAVLIWFSLFCALRVPADANSRRIASLAAVATTAAMVLSFASYTAKYLVHGCPDSVRTQIDVARQLHLPDGTAVAVIGAGNFSYWAHLARVRIVAEIMQMDEDDFWKLPDLERKRFLSTFRSTGARWLIAQPPTVLLPTLNQGWKRVGTTAYYRYPLIETGE